MTKKGIPLRKIIKYPGVKEGIFLWSKGMLIHKQREIHHPSDIHIYIRPEPPMAQYYTGKENFLDPVIIALQQKYKIKVLTRDANPSAH